LAEPFQDLCGSEGNRLVRQANETFQGGISPLGKKEKLRTITYCRRLPRKLSKTEQKKEKVGCGSTGQRWGKKGLFKMLKKGRA